MAGISSRTLRHYDDIGLLRPARTAANGYRWYRRDELLRLQRILLLRELNVPLPQIRQVLNGDTDELPSLRRHRNHVENERDRLTEVLNTIDKTIADLEGAATLEDEAFFTGLAVRTQALHEDLTSRYGKRVREHIANAATVTADWSREDHERAADQGQELLRRLSFLRGSGVSPSADHVLDVMAEHYEAVRVFWPADAAAYHALADVILNNPDQRAMIQETDPELPPWLAEAIRAYATTRLGLTG